MTKSTIPVHGFKPATEFLNKQLDVSTGVKVTLMHWPIDGYRYGADDPYHHYAFRRGDDGRRVTICGLDAQWRDRKISPTTVDWSKVELFLHPEQNYEGTVNRTILFELHGLERVAGLKLPLQKLWTQLFDNSGADSGFFAYESPQIMEYRRRLMIENAEKKLSEVRQTIKRHKARGPFMLD